MNMFPKRHGVSIIMAMALSISTFSYAEDPVQTDPEIDKINQKYAEEYKRIADQGEKLSKESPDGFENVVGVDVDFSKMRDVSFDVPEFRMKTQKISFDLPSVTMRLKRIVWDNPEVTMKLVKTGQYPEFYGTTVKWSNLYAHVPVTTMVKREIKLDVPEFHTSRVDLSFDIPEIFKTNRVSFKIPEIKIQTTEQGVAKVKEGGAQLASAAQALSKSQKIELLSLSKSRLQSSLNDLIASRDEAINNMNSSIAKLKEFGINTKSVPQEDGSKIDMEAQLELTKKGFAESEQAINKSLSEIDQQMTAANV